MMEKKIYIKKITNKMKTENIKMNTNRHLIRQVYNATFLKSNLNSLMAVNVMHMLHISNNNID